MAALSRSECFRLAEAVRQAVAWQLPDGAQLVVVVTDEAAEWVGVLSNVGNERTEVILRAALVGVDTKEPEVIDTEGATNA